jgi:hypothetical protein
MSDRSKFEVKCYPAVFNDASKGTIVSIVYNYGTQKPIFPPHLTALRALTKSQFMEAVGSSNGVIVTDKISEPSKLDGQQTIAAVHIPKGHESPNLAEKVTIVVNLLNQAFPAPQA